MIKVAVFCGADDTYTVYSEDTALKAVMKLDKLFETYQTSDVCTLRDVRMIYGGGDKGIMGLAAQVAEDRGIPIYAYYMDCLEEEIMKGPIPDAYTVYHGFHERINGMYRAADIIIVLPGSIGTLTELFLCMQINMFKEVKKPILIFNIDGYYDNIIPFIQHSTSYESCDVTIL